MEFLQSRKQRNLAQYMGEREWARIVFLAAEWAKLTPVLAREQWLKLPRSVGAEQLTVAGELHPNTSSGGSSACG